MRFVAAESFTLSAWIKPSGLRSSDEAVFTKSRNAGNYYGLWINAANHWAFRGPGGDVVGPAAVADSWTHVAIVQDGNAGTRSIYVNGVLGGTGPAQSANGSGDFWMGQASAPVSGAAIDSFPGLVDDVRLYRRAFDADSISLLPGPPVLQAESSQTHTGQGAHKCVIWPAKFPGIEARKGNVVGQYKIVLHFPVAVSGIAASLGLQGGGSAVGSVSSVAYDSTNKIVTVTLTGVANLQALNLHLSGIAPGNGTADIPFDIIWGDVDRDHLVSNIDLAGVVRKHANFVNDDNALCDLNGDGNVNSSDDAIVTANLGNHIGRQTDTNLSVGGIASSSSNENATNVPDGAVDGIWFTRWASLWSDPQWISVDLGETFSIHSVSLEWQNAAGATYLIQVSADNSNWTTVWTEAANNGPGIKTYTGANVQGRYVRMYGTTRTTPFGYSIWDFRINGIYPAAISAPSVTSPSTLSGTVGTSVSYQIAATNTPTSFSADNLPPGLSIDTITGVISGTPTAAATTTATLHATNDGGTGNFSLSCEIAGPPPDANLAISKSAAASSSQATTPPSAATDGDPATRWAASAATWPQSWTVDLGAVRTLSKTDIKWYSGATRAYKYRVEVSTDGAIYSPVVDKTANRTFGNNPDLFTATARYVRVTATGCSAGGAIASANEIFVFGH
ncbi:MAG: discoidin domain-containing protein [Chthoniobacterales bacterium]